MVILFLRNVFLKVLVNEKKIIYIHKKVISLLFIFCSNALKVRYEI